MSSLVSQSIKKAEGKAGSKKALSVSDAGTAATAPPKKSLAALAMEKAKSKASSAAPSSSPVTLKQQPQAVSNTNEVLVENAAPVALPKQRKPEPVRTAAVDTGDRSPARKQGTSLGKPSRVQQEPAVSSKLVEEELSDDESGFEETISSPVAPSSKQRTQTEGVIAEPKSKQRKSRARSVSGEIPVVNVKRSSQPAVATTGSQWFSVRSVVFRLSCGIAFAIIFFLLQQKLHKAIELPSSIRQLELSTGEAGRTIQYLDFKPSSEREADELRSFRENLRLSLQNPGVEDLTLEQLWETYQNVRQTNAQMFSALGLVLGFLFAGIML